MKLPEKLRKLCTPAFLYFSISMIAIILMIFQNFGNQNKYCLGEFNCYTENLGLIFVGKILYIIFWTFILNLICKSGFTGISWFLVLFPFIFMFVAIGIMILQGEPILEEGMVEGMHHEMDEEEHDGEDEIPMEEYGEERPMDPEEAFMGEMFQEHNH